MKNKTLSILLAVLMSMAASMASAHDFEVDGIYYQIRSSTTPYMVAVSYKGPSWESYSDEYTGSVTIPETVPYNGKVYSVTSIGDEAFRYCRGLTSVTIPNSVTSIGYYAFDSCSGLTSVTIPNSVTSIGNNAFQYCSSLTSVTISSSVTSIGNNAFQYCSSLTSVTIPNSVTSIGDEAFSGCNRLTSVTIPNNITDIGDYAFKGCPLTRIYSYAEYPPSCGTDVFSVVKKNCNLYVLPESVDIYNISQDWYEFNILPMDEVALSVREVGTGKGIQEYYDLQGRRRAKRQHGLNIIRRSDGTTRLLLVK